MILLYLLLAVYAIAVNVSGFFLLKRQFNAWEEGAGRADAGDGKLLVVAVLGGAAAIYAAMFILRYRLGDILLMIALPVITVLNGYAFFLGFRGIGFLY